MDAQAQRRARQKVIRADLAEAYTEEEACPPEWVDLLSRIRERSRTIQAAISAQTTAFATDPDIKRALLARDRTTQRLRAEIEQLNTLIRRLNVIAPHARFTRAALDPDELLRPFYRTPRTPSV